MEVWLVTFYCDQKSVIGNLVLSSVIFHVSSVIIIYPSTALFELDYGAIVEINVD